MTLENFFSILPRVLEHLPPEHELHIVDAVRQLLEGSDLAQLAERFELRPVVLERRANRVREAGLAAITGGDDIEDEAVRKQRFRLAQLLLGQLTEERFDREKEELAAGRLTVEDHRRGRTDTDFRVMNGGGRPIFRINIKFHGSAFRQAQVHVGLAPEDCFALATYKIHQSLNRQHEEALPYVFLVLSALGLTSQSVADLIDIDFAWFVAACGRFRKRDIEEAIVAYLLTPRFEDRFAPVRNRIHESEFRVISASRAERLLKEKLFERVFALRRKGFASAFKNAEVDMHFSLSTEMTPVRDFLRLVTTESPQRLAVLLYQGEAV